MGLLGQLSVKILVTYAQNGMIYISLPNVDVLCNVQPYITCTLHFFCLIFCQEVET